MKMPAVFVTLQDRWTTFSPVEQLLMRSAALLVGATVVWWLLVAPPLRTFTHSQAELRKLEGQWQKMQALRSQAVALQGLPKINRADALRALDSAVRQQLGTSAQLNVLGDSATLTLRSTPASALAEWLPQARVNAHALPSEARLVRDNSNPQGQALWSGTIVIRLAPQ